MTDQEKHLNEVLEGRFIKRVMSEESQDINLAQIKYMDSHGFSNQDWRTGRSFVASETALEYSQLLKVRFVDMKSISAGMAKHKKKSHPIHNRIVYGHYNNIIREMKYGFTDAVKEELRQLEQ